MDFKHIIHKIEDSDKFKEFIKHSPHYYLVHIFSLKDDNPSVWQIGYYSKETDKIVVFEYANNAISIHEPQEALKEENHIQKLDMAHLEVSMDDAIQISDNILKEYYSKEIIGKQIFLLQNLPEFGQVWNLTIVTLSFNVINIKIDAHSGKVIKHHKENLMNWKS